MNRLEPAKATMPPVKQYIDEHMREFGATRQEAKKMYNWLRSQKIYRNDLYQVAVIEATDMNGFGGIEIMHLSIKRIDKQPIHDWRDLQEIKNQIAGPEREAIEIYPAESRVMDTANQYHLWVFPEGYAIPIGWTERHVTNESKGGAVQRPRSDDQ